MLKRLLNALKIRKSSRYLGDLREYCRLLSKCPKGLQSLKIRQGIEVPMEYHLALTLIHNHPKFSKTQREVMKGRFHLNLLKTIKKRQDGALLVSMLELVACFAEASIYLHHSSESPEAQAKIYSGLARELVEHGRTWRWDMNKVMDLSFLEPIFRVIASSSQLHSVPGKPGSDSDSLDGSFDNGPEIPDAVVRPRPHLRLVVSNSPQA